MKFSPGSRGGTQNSQVLGRRNRFYFVHFRVAKGFDMKAFFAACIAVGVLWTADVEMNGGRYSDVVKRAVVSVLPK